MSDEFTSSGRITIHDRETKETRTINWGPGHSIEYWWQEGNGHCDCNRGLYFWGYKDIEVRCGHSRYVITHVDGHEVDFEEWNSAWEASV